jgi:hypothetical protein
MTPGLTVTMLRCCCFVDRNRNRLSPVAPELGRANECGVNSSAPHFASWRTTPHVPIPVSARYPERNPVRTSLRALQSCGETRRPGLVGELQNKQIVGTRTLLAPARVQGSTTPLRVRSTATPHTPSTRRDDTVALENGTIVIPYPTEPHHIAFLLLFEHPLHTIRPSTPSPIAHLHVPTRFWPAASHAELVHCLCAREIRNRRRIYDS